MAVSTRIDPIDRDVRLIIDELLSPAARSRQLAQMAGEMLSEADETNKRVLGRIPRKHTFVDGAEGRQLNAVRPDGVIVREYELMTDVLRFIADDLVAHSPIGRAEAGDRHPGLYKRSHTLFADATEIPIGAVIPPADEYVFINMLDYARRLEGGSSLQWNHIYEGTASAARRRFSNVAKITFTYRGIVGGRNPGASGAIVRKRETGRHAGRFAHQGGSKPQNVASVRYPAIVVRNY